MLTAADPPPRPECSQHMRGSGEATAQRPFTFSVVGEDDIFLRSRAEGAVFDEGMHMMKEAGCHHGVSDAKGEISEKQSHLWVQPYESVGEKRAFHHITEGF